MMMIVLMMKVTKILVKYLKMNLIRKRNSLNPLIVCTEVLAWQETPL